MFCLLKLSQNLFKMVSGVTSFLNCPMISCYSRLSSFHLVLVYQLNIIFRSSFHLVLLYQLNIIFRITLSSYHSLCLFNFLLCVFMFQQKMLFHSFCLNENDFQLIHSHLSFKCSNDWKFHLKFTAEDLNK